MSEIQKADPKLRRQLIVIVLVVAAIGSALIMLLQLNQDTLKTWIVDHKEYLVAHPEVVAFVFFVFMLPLLGGAVYLWRFASRVIAARRFPPPGMRVIRDTPVLSENRALVRGRVLQFLAVILFLNSLGIPVMVWFLFRSFAGN